MIRTRLLPWGLLAVMGGCASHGVDDSIDGPIDFRVTNDMAEYQTTMHIELAGRATQTLPDGHIQTRLLDRATIDDLRAKIADAQFAALPATIGCLGCADGNVYEVDVVLDGSLHAVAADQFAPWPAPLKTVIDTLGGLAGVPPSKP